MREDRRALEFCDPDENPPLEQDVLRLFRLWHSQGKLGFMELPFDGKLLQETLDMSKDLSMMCDRMIVCGIGGSSLGLRALLSAMGRIHGRVTVADSPDTALLRRISQTHDPERTLLTAVTKSGSTAETLSIFTWLLGWMSASPGFNQRIVAITDPVQGDLRKLAGERGWRSLPVPPEVGGRFSVLSPVALFPAAFAGIDIGNLLDGAGSIAQDFWDKGSASIAAGIASGFLSRFRRKPVHVFMPYDDRLFDAALWFSQLWAESLGKRTDLNGEVVNTGQTPLACRGPADQHSLLQLFMEGPPDKAVTIITTPAEEGDTFIGGDFQDYSSIRYLLGSTPDQLRLAEAKATGAALQEAGVPVAFIKLKTLDAYSLGQLLMTLEIATVLTGLALNINPLDQPGVERSKILTYQSMNRPGYTSV